MYYSLLQLITFILFTTSPFFISPGTRRTPSATDYYKDPHCANHKLRDLRLQNVALQKVCFYLLNISSCYQYFHHLFLCCISSSASVVRALKQILRIKPTAQSNGTNNSRSNDTNNSNNNSNSTTVRARNAAHMSAFFVSIRLLIQPLSPSCCSVVTSPA